MGDGGTGVEGGVEGGVGGRTGEVEDLADPTRPVCAPHADALIAAMLRFRVQAPRLDRWSRWLAAVLARGGRLLACGNGGSAAEAQHLTAELVGRYRDERRPLAAIPLHGDTSAATAILNDYGPDELFARQVYAHGRPGDVLICLSTSGRSRNVLAAADAGRAAGLTVWAFTGPAPNPLAARCDATVAVDAAETATIQEVHLAAVHMLCAGVDAALSVDPARASAREPSR